MLWHKTIGAGGRGGGGPLEYVGGYTTGRSGTTGSITVTYGGSLTGGSGSSASAGDIVVVFTATSSRSQAPSSPAITGYTLEATVLASNYNIQRHGLLYKVLGSSESSFTYTAGTGGTSGSAVFVVMVFRNAARPDPFDVATVTASGSNSYDPNPPSITSVTDGSIVLFSGHTATTLSGTYTMTAPSGADEFLYYSQPDTSYTIAGAGFFQQTTAGSLNPGVIDASNSGYDQYAAWAAMTAVIRPA